MTGTSRDEVVQAWVTLVSAGLRLRPLGTCRGQGRTLSLHSCVPVPESLFASPERVPEPPTEGPSSPTSPAGQMQGLVIGVTSILVGVLLLLLLTWALATAFPRAMRGNVLAAYCHPRGAEPKAMPTASSTSPYPHCRPVRTPAGSGWTGPPRIWGPSETPAVSLPPCLLSEGA